MERMSFEDREARIAEIETRLTELDTEHADEVMPDEARDEWNSLNAEREEQATAVAEIRARRERLRQFAGNPDVGERAEPPTMLTRRSGAEIYDLVAIRGAARSEDDYRDRLHDNARRAIERTSFPATAGGNDKAREHVIDLLERVDDESGTLAKRILATGSPLYDRAFGKMLSKGVMSLTSEEQRAMSVGTDTEGGFAVPFQLDPTVILTNDGAMSPLRQIARVEQVTSKTWQGITSEGITVSRSAEEAEADDNSFTIAQPEVSPQRVIADVRFSVELDQDWSQFRSEVARLLADAKMVEEDTSFITGDGTGVEPGGIPTTLTAGEAVAGGVFDVDALYALESETPVRFRGRGRFLANKSTYNTIRGFSTGSDGGDLWVRLASGQPSELLGYPAHEASAMASHVGTGATGNRYLLFGDFSQFLIVDRLGMTVEVNPHIVGTNGRWTGQRAIVAVWRNSSLVLNANAFRYLEDDAA